MSKLLWTYVSSGRVLLRQLYTFTWFWFNSSNVDFPWKCFSFLVIIVDDGVVECGWRITTWHIWLLIVDVLNPYMINIDVECGDCMYIWRRLLVTTNTCIQLLVTICVNICIVVDSYIHAYMTYGDGFYIRNDDDYDIFVASKGTTLLVIGTTCM